MLAGHAVYTVHQGRGVKQDIYISPYIIYKYLL